ncbi:hypothetical protein ILYODFUR_004483 [Ilyodon furcidens]|uniref:Uncharacterized protein n=1 Tax=Ilyodon furcidens TaxID=33524 RepID=A0ABV0T6I4_9TELE
MRDTRPNNADKLNAAIKADWASLNLNTATGLSQCHAALMHYSCKSSPNRGLNAQTVQYMGIIYRRPTILWSYTTVTFSGKPNFGFLIVVSHNHQKTKKHFVTLSMSLCM